MLLVGNDIVDLREARLSAKARQPRFLSRVLSPDEHRSLAGADDPELLLWLYWAVKETAYKLISKVCKIPPPFCHREFRVTLLKGSLPGDAAGEAQVSYDGRNIRVRYEQDRFKLHAYACLDFSRDPSDYFFVPRTKCFDSAELRTWKKNPRFDKAFSDEERVSIHHGDSAFVRFEAKRDISSLLGFDPKRIEIMRPLKENRMYPPFVRIDHDRCDVDLSLSHHGRWIGWVFSVPKNMLSL